MFNDPLTQAQIILKKAQQAMADGCHSETTLCLTELGAILDEHEDWARNAELERQVNAQEAREYD